MPGGESGGTSGGTSGGLLGKLGARTVVAATLRAVQLLGRQFVLGQTMPEAMKEADVLLVDGTFWTDDEMISSGLSSKRAIDMGHLSQSGSGGMIEALAPYSKKRRILIHINNTNPILREDSPQALQLKALGIEVAYDGMHIEI